MNDKAQTFILLSREIINWRWFKDDKTFRMFIYCLVKANFKDADFLKHKIKRGEFATSLKSISEATEMTISQCRTALDHLVETGEIKIKSTNKFSIISVQNYDKYQDFSSYSTLLNNKQIANKSQTTDKQIANKSQTNRNQIATSNTYNTSNTFKALEEEGDRFGDGPESIPRGMKIATLEEARKI